MKYKCLLVDNEELALNTLREFVNQLDQLELIACCDNAIWAFEILQTQQVDLLLVNIQMPNLNGLGLIHSFTNPPKVILTTTCRDYAIEGFELNIADYLLKPISFETFSKSISRVFSLTNEIHDKIQTVFKEKREEYLYVKSDKKMLKIFLSDILFMESLGSCVQIVTKDKKVICYKRIAEFDEELQNYGFYRVHKSFIVSLDLVDSYSATAIEIKNHKIPIGRNYKKEFIEKMRKMSSGSILFK